jgi:hypothetical protein
MSGAQSDISSQAHYIYILATHIHLYCATFKPHFHESIFSLPSPTTEKWSNLLCQWGGKIMGLDGKLNFYDGALLLFVLRKAEEHISEMFFHDASANSFDTSMKITFHLNQHYF